LLPASLLRARRAAVLGLQSPPHGRRPARYSHCAPSLARGYPLAEGGPPRNSDEGLDLSARISLKHRQSLDVGGSRRFRVHHERLLFLEVTALSSPASAAALKRAATSPSSAGLPLGWPEAHAEALVSAAAARHGPEAFFEFLSDGGQLGRRVDCRGRGGGR
jgi:hypothetical protein